MFGRTPGPAAAAPPPRPGPARQMTAAQYEAHKSRVGRRQREHSLAARDIGPIPPPLHPRRRELCRLDLARFCKTYLPHHFPLEWSRAHRRILALLQRAILTGGRAAYAMPRGFGKTTLASAAALWAAVYGHRRYILIVSATGAEAAKVLRGMKTAIETTPELAEDFPAVTYPVQRLEGIVQRGPGQLSAGRPTRLAWKHNQIVLADIEGAASAGAIIETVGITGAIRGRRYVLTTGENLRPELVLIDDPQTRRSAASREQTKARLDTIAGDILGLNVPLAVVCTVTVIQPNDLADQLLTAKENYAWQGQKAGILSKLPDNLDLWDEYGQLLRADLSQGRTHHPAATAFYRKHRQNMDAGTEATWPARYIRRRELSAVQFAMNLYLDNPAAFWAEYMNAPQVEQAAGLTIATADTIARKWHDHAQGIVPAEAPHLTAFIDVHGRALFWLVAAWQQNLTGYVIDYGTHPDQRRRQFTLANLPATIGRHYPGRTEEAALRAAIDDLADRLLLHDYPTADGLTKRVDVCLIDTGWNASAVYAACAASPHAPRLQPSKGYAIGPARRPMSEWSRRPGDSIGPGYLYTRPQKRHARTVFIDANHWKTNVHRALARLPHEPGGLELFRPALPDGHQLLTGHLLAETPTETFGQGRTVFVWTQNPDRPDNHWLDCIVGSMTAAALRGCTAAPLTAPEPRPTTTSPGRPPAATEPEPEPEDEPVSYLKV